MSINNATRRDLCRAIKVVNKDLAEQLQSCLLTFSNELERASDCLARQLDLDAQENNFESYEMYSESLEDISQLQKDIADKIETINDNYGIYTSSQNDGLNLYLDYLIALKYVNPKLSIELELSLLRLAYIVENSLDYLYSNIVDCLRCKEYPKSHTNVDIVAAAHTLLKEIQDIFEDLDRVDLQEITRLLDGSTREYDLDIDIEMEVPETREETTQNEVAQKPKCKFKSVYAYEAEPRTLDEDFLLTFPNSFSCLGSNVAVKSWKDLLICTYKYLLKKDATLLYKLAEEDALKDTPLVYLSKNDGDLNCPNFINGHDFYFEIAYNANQIRDVIKSLLRIYGIAENEYRIHLKMRRPGW